MVLDYYQSYPYISLRVWARGSDGVMRPVAGKGCSVKIHEAERVAEALASALKLADSPGGGRDGVRNAHEQNRRP